MKKDILIITKNLSKYYTVGDETIKALDDVNLEIERGQIVAILGTSGSGKSTLLNMLAGLERPTKGEVHIGKFRIDELTEEQLTKFRQRYTGFIFQAYNLLPTLTALENVAFPLCFRGVDKQLREKKAFEMLKLVGIEKRYKHKPAEMSGGQQQRVGIARALVTDPSIIFADEPTGNLDSHTTQEVMELIRNIVDTRHNTVIMVTHDKNVAAYADIIVNISDGKVISKEYKKNMENLKDEKN
ncbi:ABC transporter ATP-binding protein [uncultured Eubacterium sp.]|uniref:ABC transporter ATP-binding protein n=1 Tax=uncultured Eubacterium sp. TaxID=165185 RepID=UPI0025DC10AA|nr:ABC transporter ATP-binding protein [uncultured Eubacterium sp.]